MQNIATKMLIYVHYRVKQNQIFFYLPISCEDVQSYQHSSVCKFVPGIPVYELGPCCTWHTHDLPNPGARLLGRGV